MININIIMIRKRRFRNYFKSEIEKMINKNIFFYYCEKLNVFLK